MTTLQKIFTMCLVATGDHEIVKIPFNVVGPKCCDLMECYLAWSITSGTQVLLGD